VKLVYLDSLVKKVVLDFPEIPVYLDCLVQKAMLAIQAHLALKDRKAKWVLLDYRLNFIFDYFLLTIYFVHEK
jgi:hypothetical protein